MFDFYRGNSLLFEPEKSPAYNQALLAGVLSAGEGRVVCRSSVSRKAGPIHSESAIPTAYLDYATRITEQCGASYSCSAEKYAIYHSPKRVVYRVSEEFEFDKRPEELFAAAKRRADGLNARLFSGYESDELYARHADSRIITDIALELTEGLAAGARPGLARITPEKLRGVGLDLRFDSDATAFVCKVSQEPYYPQLLRSCGGAYVDAEAVCARHGYRALEEKQRVGVNMAVQRKVCELLCELYPAAALFAYRDTRLGEVCACGINILELEPRPPRADW